MTDTIEEIRARHEAWDRASECNDATKQCHADRATLLRALDEAQEELSTWQSVFPDIAPASVLPDRSKLEAELLAMAEENARLREALAILDAADEFEGEPDNKKLFVAMRVADLRRARAALKEPGSFTNDPFNRAVLGLEPGQ